MHNILRSADPSSSEAPKLCERHMTNSLADELEGVFEDISFNLADPLDETEILDNSLEEITKNVGKLWNVVLEGEDFRGSQSNSSSPTMVDTDPDSPATIATDDETPAATKTDSNATLIQTPRRSNFVEHLSSDESGSQPKSHKDCTVLLASKHNRELIERDANGFFDMESMPNTIDVQRRIQQSEGITALQRTLVPANLSAVASTNIANPHASSFTAVDSIKRPSTVQHVTFAESQGRRPNKIQRPNQYTAKRTKAASHFSLGRNLIAAGHKKRLSEPSAPSRFVRLPTDPIINFKRNFRESGLKIQIPGPDLDDAADSRASIATIPDVESAGSHQFQSFQWSEVNKVILNPCLEPSCPIRWAHAKGPYHHQGKRHNKIMTGLFGHSNPPPEIWSTYRDMVHLTSGGRIISPDGGPESKAKYDLVIAFAKFHFGAFNGMNGEEFHRRYAGKHISSRLAIQSSSFE